MMRAIRSNQLMLNNPLERSGPIDQDYDPWNQNDAPDAVFKQVNLLREHVSSAAEISNPLGLDPSRPISPSELRSIFPPSVDDIQLNWQYTSNSAAKPTLDHSCQLYEENQVDLHGLLESELDLDLVSNQSALHCLDHASETLKSFEELFDSNLNQGLSVQPEDCSLIIRSCSACGILKPHSELSHLRPCLHPHCNTCINTLLNSSCNDPPPPQMVCFLCSQPVTGFDLPIAFEIFQHKYSNSSPPNQISSTSHAESFQTALIGLDSVNLKLPSDDPFGFHLGSLSSGRSQDLSDETIPTFLGESPLSFTSNDSRNSCSWPIVRVDNISWSLTVADILNWLPDGLNCLPPPELCPLPVHILCNPIDGKTLNFCFIEMRNLPAAHFLVRHRHGTKIGIRLCSVVLTSTSELHSNILGGKTMESSQDIFKIVQFILKLCDPHNKSSIKASERAFFHLMSLLSHYENLSNSKLYPFSNEDGSNLLLQNNWTGILQVAIETLLSCNYKITESSNILRVMVGVGISSPSIDREALFQFLSQVEVFFNQISTIK